MAQKSRRRAPALKLKCAGRLLGEQQIARVLDRCRDGALLAGGEPGVLTRKDLAGVGDVTAHQLRSGERKVLRRKAVLGGFWRGRAAHKSRVGHEAMRPRACQQVCPKGLSPFFGEEFSSVAEVRAFEPQFSLIVYSKTGSILCRGANTGIRIAM